MVVVSSKTAESYAIIIKKVRDAVASGSSGLSFLAKSEEILAWIEGQPWANNTKKNYYIALKSTCRDAGDPKLKSAEEAYNTRMLFYRDEVVREAAKQEMSERERKLFVRWPTILAAKERLRENVSDFFDFQEFVIYCLYTLAPPVRLDYSPMEVVEDREEAEVSLHNCLIKSEWKFLFRNYKTQSKYGVVELDICPALREVLQEWVELNPSGWLLCDKTGVPLTEKYLGQHIQNVMKKATGKPIGASMLRHIYISHQRRGELSYKKQNEMAKAQMHSPSMSVLYRKIK
jgi:hypothetical protein